MPISLPNGPAPRRLAAAVGAAALDGLGLLDEAIRSAVAGEAGDRAGAPLRRFFTFCDGTAPTGPSTLPSFSHTDMKGSRSWLSL